MLRKRKRPLNEYLEPITFARLVLTSHPDLTRDYIEVLVAVWAFSCSGNKPVSKWQVVKSTGLRPGHVNNLISELHSQGYLKRVVNDQLLTMKGETLVKGLEIQLGRMVEELRAVKWKNPKGVDPSLMYPAIRKGVKLY